MLFLRFVSEFLVIYVFYQQNLKLLFTSFLPMCEFSSAIRSLFHNCGTIAMLLDLTWRFHFVIFILHASSIQSSELVIYMVIAIPITP